ncbi:MAG: hypothetical protein AAF609_21875 [Cyanobacteria bacterium P01_C01_bin.120]
MTQTIAKLCSLVCYALMVTGIILFSSSVGAEWFTCPNLSDGWHYFDMYGPVGSYVYPVLIGLAASLAMLPMQRRASVAAFIIFVLIYLYVFCHLFFIGFIAGTIGFERRSVDLQCIFEGGYEKHFQGIFLLFIAPCLKKIVARCFGAAY